MKVGTVVTGTAIILIAPLGPGAVVKNNSLPFRDQAGECPPLVEMGFPPPAPGYGRTNTSGRPDSSDTYANQRPFGENSAWPSLNRVTRLGTGWRSPVSGSTQMSEP